MRTLLYLLALAAFPAAGSPPSLTPEATFDLYARTMLQNDADSQHEFDARIGPALGEFRGRHPDVPAIAWALSRQSHRVLFQGASPDEVKTARRHWAIEVQRRTHCRAVHSEVRDRLEEGFRVADVHFSCDVADVDALSLLYDASLFDRGDTSDIRFWSAYRTLLSDGPFRVVDGNTRLISAPGSSTWHSEGPGVNTIYGQVEKDVGEVLMRAWLPMQRWLFETMRRAEMQKTRVAECDELIQRYRRCAAHLEPQKLADADARAQRLSIERKDMADAELAQQCVALRPKIDAMWPEPCK